MGAPVLKCSIDVPANLIGIADRHHNRLIKESLRKVLIEHHRKRIPLHFKDGNRQKYGHMERKPKYRAQKMRYFRSRTDLVKTGKTRDQFTTMAQIRIGGSASGSAKYAPGVRGQLIMRFPFPANYQASGTKVDVAQMIKEISAWTDSEASEASQQFAALYTQAVKDLLARSPRMKLKPKGGTP